MDAVFTKPSISLRTAMAVVAAAVAKANYGLPSQDLFHAIKDDPALLTSMPQVPRLTLIGGGLPIAVDNAIVGAVGVSGGTVDQDVECAQAALRGLEPAEI